MKRIGCPVGLCENASDGGNGSGSKPFLKQTATINIDEYGARVASVSSSGGLWALPPAALQLNRPFLYLIRETSTGVILYIGAIVQL